MIISIIFINMIYIYMCMVKKTIVTQKLTEDAVNMNQVRYTLYKNNFRLSESISLTLSYNIVLYRIYSVFSIR